MVSQAERGRYGPSKAKYSGRTPIAHKYREGTVKSTPKGGLKGRETIQGEPGREALGWAAPGRGRF